MVRSLVRGLQISTTSGKPKGSRTDNTTSWAEAAVTCVLESRTAGGLQYKQPHQEVGGSRSWDPCQKGTSSRHESSEVQNTAHTCIDTNVGGAGLLASLVINSLGQAIQFVVACMRSHWRYVL